MPSMTREWETVMKTVHRKTVAAAGLAALAIFGAGACSNDSSTESSPAASATSPAVAESMADPAADLVGAGCAGYAEQVPSGPGSVAGMSQDPVTVAASNNPVLTTLTSALSGKLNPNVNLVDTLNGSEFTVFAPTDDAFAKLDPATIEIGVVAANDLEKEALVKRVLDAAKDAGNTTARKTIGKRG